MSYCTQSDIEKIETLASLVQLTDDRPVDDDNAGTIDTANLTEAITLADGYIDSKLKGHVSLPLATPVSCIITQLSAELAIINLYKRRFGSAMPETMMKRQAWADKVLSEIVNGTIIISDEHAAQESGEAIKISTREKQYTEDLMRQF